MYYEGIMPLVSEYYNVWKKIQQDNKFLQQQKKTSKKNIRY
jgi:hypothetical protein